MTKREARNLILEAANKYMTAMGPRHGRSYSGTRMVTMKRINRAVNIVRTHKLVDPEVLEAAGFRATR